MTRFTGAALAPIGCQFALARPILDPPRFRYDHERQLAVTDDDAAVPLIMMPGAPEKTTTGTADKNPRGEEFRIDFAADHQ